MLRYYQINNAKIAETDNTNGNILFFVNPTDDEKRLLINDYKIDEHTLNSALDPDELSRIETEPDHIAIIFKRPKNYSSKDDFHFKVVSTGLFLFSKYLIIVLPEDVPLFESKLFNRLNSIEDVMLKVISRSIYHFMEHLKVINMIAEELEQKINRAMENRYLINMFTLEKSLIYYLNAIDSNGVLIDKMKAHSTKLNFSTEQVETLEDLIIENHQCYRQAEIYSNILGSLISARASIVNNNLSVIMKKLNAVVISIAVPSFFAGVGGMSEFTMMTNPKNWKVPYWPIAYLLFILLNVGIGLITYRFVVRWEKLEK
ncbi:MAG: magnesium transporter CorA family protein [Elusimicrobiota bacterium]